MKALTLTLIIVGLFVYVTIGGIIFSALETPQEDETRVSAIQLKQRFITDYSGCVSEEDLQTLIKGIITAYDQGIDLSSNGSNPSNWDTASAIFFATTVVTTIGYGNISPTSVGGMVFCIFFALFGIPFFAVAAGALGIKLKDLTNFLSEKLTSSCCSKHPKAWQNLRSISILLTAICIFIFLPAGIFTALEEWSYAESVYYCFVTLTTIGFGDFVAGAATTGTSRTIYRLLLSFWILFGLAWMASFISLVQEIYDKVVDKTEKQVNVLKKDVENSTKPDENEMKTGSNEDSKTSGEHNKGFTKDETQA